MSLIDVVDFKSGVIEFDKFIDISVPICSQESMLTEDMFQVHYSETSTLIDIGWTPEIDCTGKFKIYLIKDENWNQPVKSFSTNTLQRLIEVTQQYVQLAPCPTQIPG